ncbi:coniferyl aldehyde dehydrogenase [Gammaproteobacteria bacterium]|nr:coniferyl aldehyde dehydrogenase [Gammaproteobacteria bacterium]MDA7786858.1 coniferyl aldehyde dehydrogenase [Gammaproteobacteria bacterium]MDA7802407.1 coniferyl aldehyde dehydrogenase [Gammaproteobacteria bacterium]MDA7856532.1 coniferyl aldehyde dehydrogenase [Gammaproteobacteria bacterium]MDA8957809.1 coniferyl aldehyde dehydrogenase [Gammaproteobacteria bacterium]|tara:strand:- start:952 stop:2385 length:1434 start_codon:yes stop_codon:yes gene_type:complete
MNSTFENMNDVLNLQKKKFIKDGPPSIELRVDRLNRLKAMLVENRYGLTEALSSDFGSRSKNASLLSDVYTVLPEITNAIKNIKKWTKDEKRSSNKPFSLFGAKSYIRYEPLGTIGMISPWNFPVNLAFGPLASIFAAGNQVMHKPSELTPATAALMKELCDKAYDQDEFATFLGGPETGEAFSKLNFDHLLYTGSGNVGKHVMNAAAQNLVPVTLELGGKSPVVVGNSADIKASAKRVMFGKTMNAGQICLAPDYVMVHKDKKDEFISEAEKAVADYYPDIKNNDDYTSIINERHFNRLNGLIDDAREKGATINQINPANEDFNQQEFYKIPPTIITNTTEDMRVMNEEIFGPVLPVVEYTEVKEALDTINSKDRPLGLYYFGNDKNEQSNVLNNTSSGGVTINNVVGHIQQQDLPFGGVGPSGMGRYHSQDGFKNFSNPRAVFKDVPFFMDNMAFGMIRPPYKEGFENFIKKILK